MLRKWPLYLSVVHHHRHNCVFLKNIRIGFPKRCGDETLSWMQGWEDWREREGKSIWRKKRNEDLFSPFRACSEPSFKADVFIKTYFHRYSIKIQAMIPFVMSAHRKGPPGSNLKKKQLPGLIIKSNRCGKKSLESDWNEYSSCLTLNPASQWEPVQCVHHSVISEASLPCQLTGSLVSAIFHHRQT